MDADLETTLRAYADAVRRSPHNLVSRRARTELWDRHIAESLAFARMLPGDQRLLDVGSGGGLPGVVIAAARPDLDVTLLDSSGKKVAFLREVGRQLAIPFQILHGRAEEIAAARGAASFDVVTARAVAPLPRLLPWTMPFLVPGGLLYAIKGASWEREVEDAATSLAPWDAQVMATPDDLPSDDPAAPLVVVVKRGGA